MGRDGVAGLGRTNAAANTGYAVVAELLVRLHPFAEDGDA